MARSGETPRARDWERPPRHRGLALSPRQRASPDSGRFRQTDGSQTPQTGPNENDTITPPHPRPTRPRPKRSPEISSAMDSLLLPEPYAHDINGCGPVKTSRGLFSHPHFMLAPTPVSPQMPNQRTSPHRFG